MTANKWVRIATLTMAVLASAAVPAAAQEKLNLTTMSPAGSTNSTQLFAPWVARINEQGKGAVQVEARDGATLANFGNIYERVTDDVVQIGWLIHGLLGGRFGLTEVSGLPFMTDTAEQGSVALWRLYKSGMLDAEYRDIVPLTFGVFGQFQLHFAKSVASLDNLRGLKIAATGKSSLEIIERLGGYPVSIPPQDVYVALQRGTIDGVMTAWSAVDVYRLAEVTTFHVAVSLGTTPSMMFMSKKKYDGLSAAARKAIDDNSGEKGSREFGMYLDRQVTRMRDPSMLDPKTHTVVELTGAQAGLWRQAIAPLIAQWESSHANGQAILASYRNLLAQAKAEMPASGK